MNNTTLIRITLSMLITAITCLSISIFIEEHLLRVIAGISSAFFVLSGTHLLLKNGSFIKSREFPYAGIGLSVFLIGSIFQIMHWPYSSLITGIGLLLFIISYCVEFFKREYRKNVDYGKPLFLLLFLMGYYFNLMHWPFATIIIATSVIILTVPVLYFIKQHKLEI